MMRSRSISRSISSPLWMSKTQPVNVADVPEPWIEQPQIGRLHGGLYPIAVVMPTNHNVFDFQVSGCIGYHRLGAQIGVGHHVRDVTVDKRLPRFYPHQLLGCHPAVGTSDIEEFQFSTSNNPWHQSRGKY